MVVMAQYILMHAFYFVFIVKMYGVEEFQFGINFSKLI
jgi:hypothetical protein